MKKQSMSVNVVKVLLVVVCSLEFLASAEKQIFDFLGFMWLPILFNFFNMVFIIFGIFGAWQSKFHYLLAYNLWNLAFIAWNVFVICFYLEAGSLKRTDDLLSFGTGSFSWFLANGLGCNPEYFHNVTATSTVDDSAGIYAPIRPSRVSGCVLDYYIVETIHAGLHLTLALVGLSLATVLLIELHRQVEEKKKEQSKSIYSIEYSPQVNEFSQETQLYSNLQEDVRPQMTPRRVKRRSHTRSSSRSLNPKSTSNRNRRASTRSLGSLRGSGKTVSPVTRLIDHNGSAAMSPDSSTSNEEPRLSHNPNGQPQQLPGYGQINPAYESSRPNSIYSGSSRAVAENSSRPPSALTSYSNFHGQRKYDNNFMRSTANHLTQETLLNTNHNMNSNANNARSQFNPTMNSSFDDLPPPPPPIAAQDEQHDSNHQSASNNEQTSSQIPVPQQRNNSGRRNEYVNMPIVNGSDNGDYPPAMNGFDSSNVQTLKARGHMLVQQPSPTHQQSPNISFGAVPKTKQHQQPFAQLHSQPQSHHLGRNGGIPHAQPQTASSEDDYGFSAPNHHSSRSNGPLLPPRQPQVNQQPQPDDKWYLKDSMRPVGSSVHGGNCKCYRCQRKLTAI